MALTLLLNAQLIQIMTITLTWNVNIEPDLAGYKVHHGTVQPGLYETVTDVGLVNTFQVPLGSGTHYFAVTAYDQAGNDSDFSNVVSITVDLTPPAAPTGLQIVPP